jgi:hypothetical protein
MNALLPQLEAVSDFLHQSTAAAAQRLRFSLPSVCPQEPTAWLSVNTLNNLQQQLYLNWSQIQP